jgi:hypothetical protein
LTFEKRVQPSFHASPKRKRGRPGRRTHFRSLALFDVALSETEIQEARGASFDVALSETEIKEARGASRGNAFRGSNNVIFLSLRFGLRST